MTGEEFAQIVRDYLEETGSPMIMFNLQESGHVLNVIHGSRSTLREMVKQSRSSGTLKEAMEEIFYGDDDLETRSSISIDTTN